MVNESNMIVTGETEDYPRSPLGQRMYAACTLSGPHEIMVAGGINDGIFDRDAFPTVGILDIK
jgi:hypothetical protein